MTDTAPTLDEKIQEAIEFLRDSTEMGEGSRFAEIADLFEPLAADSKRYKACIMTDAPRDPADALLVTIDRVLDDRRNTGDFGPLCKLLQRARDRIAVLESRLAAPLPEGCLPGSSLTMSDLVECLRDWSDMCEQYSMQAADLIERLARRNAELEADARRLDWIQDNPTVILPGTTSAAWLPGFNLRHEIDLALAAGGGR